MVGSINNHPFFSKDGELIPYVAPEMYGELGSADGRTQAYCYRVTLTDDPENMIPIAKPENYNPALYEIVIRRFAIEPDLHSSASWLPCY